MKKILLCFAFFTAMRLSLAQSSVPMIAFQKDKQIVVESLDKKNSVLLANDFSSIENNLWPQDLLVRFPDQVSEKLVIQEGWVLYTAVQSPYNADEWLCLERTIIGKSFHLFLFNTATAQRQLLISDETFPDDYAFRPVCWSVAGQTVFIERIEFDSPFEHEGIFFLDLDHGSIKQLGINAKYMSTPILSPDRSSFVYSATSKAEREPVHGSADKIMVYEIGQEKESIISEEVGGSYYPLGWFTDEHIEKTTPRLSAMQASAQLDFKLPWVSGLTYCVTRDGSNSPPGGPGSGNTCSNLGPHSYPAATDFDTPNNASDKILAVAPGTVTTVIYSSTSYGNHVIITHADNYRTLYAHLSSIAVTQGQAVQQGCYIGIEGTTGNSSGDHLHFEYEYPGGSGNLYATFTDCGGCVPHRGYAYTSGNTLQSCSSIAAPPAPTISNSSSCGSVVLTRATPPAGVTYYWQGTSCGTSTSNSALTYTVSTSGNYKLRARNSSGVWSATCSSQSVTVTPAPATPPIPTVSTNDCGVKVLTRASPPAGVTYYWQTTCGNDISNPALTYNASLSGTYRLRARSGPNCWSSSCASVSVVVNSAPSPVITGQNAVCAASGGILYSTANTGNTFAWSVTGGTITSGQGSNAIVVNWAGPGMGAVTLTETSSSSGCAVTVSFNVNVGASLEPVIIPNGPLIFCEGEELVLDAGSGYVSYLWSNGATSQQISVADSGEYSVSVVDAWGCSGTSSQPVITYILPTPEIPTISFSDNVMISSAPSGNQWYWDHMPIVGATGQSLNVTQEGSYSVIVTDSLTGCSSVSGLFNPANVGLMESIEPTNSGIKIYPNPATGAFTLEMDFFNEDSHIMVLNVLGEQLLKEKVKASRAEITLGAVAPGIYIVKLFASDKIYSRKIIIK